MLTAIQLLDYEHSPDGNEVSSKANAMEHCLGGVPFIFTVDAAGQYIKEVAHSATKTRRDTDDWYRSYDRVLLLKVLKDVR